MPIMNVWMVITWSWRQRFKLSVEFSPHCFYVLQKWEKWRLPSYVFLSFAVLFLWGLSLFDNWFKFHIVCKFWRVFIWCFWSIIFQLARSYFLEIIYLILNLLVCCFLRFFAKNSAISKCK